MNNNTISNKNKNSSGLDNLQKFEAYLPVRYKDKFITGNAFIFVTKPKLFLNPYKPANGEDPSDFLSYENMCSDPFFSMFLNGETMNERDREIIYNLSYKHKDPSFNIRKSNFIKILTNEFKNFDPVDLNLDVNMDAFSTKQGYTMPLPQHTTVSNGSGVLSFQMYETDNLDITKLLTLWVKYIENVSDGTFRANPEMIQSGELDYMSSIYYFVLDPDGKTIKYWCKYTGCYPTSVPYGAFNYSKGDHTITNISVPFQYILKEDMNPKILEDFNRVSLGALNYEEVELEHLSLRESNLLSRNKLVNGEYSSTVQSEFRDPLVFYNLKSNNTIDGLSNNSFELSFADDDIEKKFYNETFDEYDTDLFKNNL